MHPDFRPSITAVIPCFNEESNIDRVYVRVRAALEALGDFEMIFVDDGSTDGSLAKMQAIADLDFRVKYLSFSFNQGLEAAFRAGFRHASKDWIVQLDGDLQSPPEEISTLLNHALQGGYDIVYALRKNRRDPLVRRLGSRALHQLALWSGIPIVRGASVFRIIRTPIAQAVIALPTRTRYFTATVPYVTRKIGTVEVSHQRRERGSSRWPSSRLFLHALELLAGFSNRGVAVLCGILLLTVPLNTILLQSVISGGGNRGLALALLAITTGMPALVLAGVLTFWTYIHPILGGGEMPAVRESNLSRGNGDPGRSEIAS